MYEVDGVELAPIGTGKIAVPEADARGVTITKLRNTAILYMGECESCAKEKIDISAINPPPDTAVVLWYDSPWSETSKSAPKLAQRVWVVCDPSLAIHTSMAPRWVPMWCRIDAEGNIVERQERPSTGASILLELGK